MSKIDDMILGGFLGALLASPKQEEVQELKKYREEQQQIEQRKLMLGNTQLPAKLVEHQKIFSNFREAYQLYLLGFYRAAALFSILTIEMVLKEKYGKLGFNNLILKAKEDEILNAMNYHFLTGLRFKRNILAHDFDDVSIDDAQVVIKLSVRMIKHIIK